MTVQKSTIPDFTRYITGHNAAGEAIIHSEGPGEWADLGSDKFNFSVAYTTSEFPPNLNNDADITQHESLLASGKPGLVNPSGTVLRVVDFAPDQPGLMHRTVSLDYGIVLEGEIDMTLDSGDKRRLRKGDIAVQRGTMHEWQNPSKTEWTRMVFVLQDCEPVVVGGKELKEDVGGIKSLESGKL